MNKLRIRVGLAVVTIAAMIAAMGAALASPPAHLDRLKQRNFVSCPIVRDTQTVPCWLAEYRGELYYLGIQTDISAAWSPPYLGHKVLVEGTVSDELRICGGIVLKPLNTSPLPELDASCNTAILPAEDRYTVPFAPRGPGPSKGRLAFAASNAPQAAPPAQLSEPVSKQFVIPYDFDWPWVTGKTARVFQQALRHAQSSKASRIEIMGFRGATMLSDGNTIVEQSGIAEQRAKQVAELLVAAGFDATLLATKWQDEPQATNSDARRVIVVVQP